jgi:hypothetical protein
MENGNGITKADLKAALSEFKTEFKAELKADLKTEMAGLKIESKADWTEPIRAMGADLTKKLQQVETNLISEFRRYGDSEELRLQALESRSVIVTERLALIDERLLHLESQRLPTV